MITLKNIIHVGLNILKNHSRDLKPGDKFSSLISFLVYIIIIFMGSISVGIS